MLFVFKSVSCHWQARAPAVERPRCAFGRVLFRPCCLSSSLCLATGKPVRPLWNARGAPLAVSCCVHAVCLQVCVLPLASPCARCGTPEVRLWPCLVPSMLFLFKSVSCHWQARAPAVERPRCAFGRVLFRPCCFSSSLCLATGKPVRPLWNARGAPLAVSCSVHAVSLQVCVLPLASPCARCGTPEVRLWPCLVPSMLFLFKSVSCHWQARAPAVERPRCAFGSLQPVRSACYPVCLLCSSTEQVFP